MPKSKDVREMLLTIIQERSPKDQFDAGLQAGSILDDAGRRLAGTDQKLILTQWYDLFRTGYLSWGINLSNPNPPWCHLTDRGQSALERISRDPGNPAGYLRHLYSMAELNPVAKSYLEEGLECYVSSFYKSAAVMIGAASESLVLDLKEFVIAKLGSLSRPYPKDLNDWRIKKIIDALKSYFDGEKKGFETQLREEYEAYWMAFTQQIRATRNEAGHPTSVEPITGDAVHASFLIFPELAKLENKLRKWVEDIS